ncbi:hypothetical protein KEM54_004128 [Ascosphaera aggregata]|nr:hypothetical protein KEM54_004128 [Ascosphaera aggregata]
MSLPTHSRKGSIINATALQEATAMLGTSPPLSLSMSTPISPAHPPSSASSSACRPVPAHSAGVQQTTRSMSIPFPSPPVGNGPAGYVDRDPKDGGPARLPTPMTVCDIHQIMEQEQEQLSNISTISLTGGTGVSGIAPSRDTNRDSISVLAAHSPGSVPHYMPQDQRQQDQLHHYYHNHNHNHNHNHHHQHQHQHRHNPSSSSITSIHAPLPGVDLRLNTNLRNVPPGEALSASPSSAIPRRSSITSAACPASNPSMLSAGLYKSELESVKKDNEMLKRRVRELENVIKQLKVSKPPASSSPSLSPSSSPSSTIQSSSSKTASKNDKVEQEGQQPPATSSSQDDGEKDVN